MVKLKEKRNFGCWRGKGRAQDQNVNLNHLGLNIVDGKTLYPKQSLNPHEYKNHQNRMILSTFILC